MTGAVIGGDLECSGSSFLFLEDIGPAFIADRAEIGGNVLLNDGFTAEGDVSLAQSTIGGTLDCRNARLQIVQQMPIDGLNLADAAVRGAFVWRPQDLQWSRIDLTRCSVGLLDDDIDCWPVTGGLFLNGFTYGRLGGNLEVKRRVAWVQLTSGFHSQPYDQLASTYRAMHRPSEAREVLIAKEKARNDTLSAWRRRAHALWGLSTAYGYKPSRAVWIFTVALVLAGFLFWWAGDSGAMEPTDPNTTATADSCTAVQRYPCYQPFVYAADVMIPVVDLGQTEAWTPNSSLQGELEDPWAISGIWTSVIEGLGGVLGWALALALAAALIHRFRS
jgi:hypothetical protein